MNKKYFLTLLAALPGFAGAQATEQVDTVSLNEVVVIDDYGKNAGVGKLDVPAWEAPMSISIMPATEISNIGAMSLNTLTRNATGIRPNNTYGGFMTFNIRGFNAFVLLNDGIRDERHNLYGSAPNTSLASVEKVEILKGASSVMYGHSALGGIVNIVHRQPTKETHVNTTMTMGSWGRYSVSGGAGGTIVNSLTYRADFEMTGGKGWRDTDNRTRNARIALKWKPTDSDMFDFVLMGKNDIYGTDMGEPHFDHDIYSSKTDALAYLKGSRPAGMKLSTRYADPKDHLYDKDILTSLRYEHSFKDGIWKFSDYLSWYFNKLDYYASEKLTYLTSSEPIYDHYYMNGNNRTYICTDSIQRAGYAFAYKTNLTQNQAEIQGRFNTGSVKHNFLGGWSFSYNYTPRYTTNYNRDATGPGKNSHVSVVDPVLNQGNVSLPFSGLNRAHEYMNGVYVQDWINITPQLSALASLRFDRYDRKYQQDVVNNTTVLSTGEESKTHDNAFTYRFSLLYQIDKRVNVFASTSNYFKPTRTVAAPGYIYVGSDGKEITPDGKNVFSPEKGYQYEVGSHMLIPNVIDANLSAFYILRTNMVQSLGTYEGSTVSGQVGKNDSKGLEFDFNVYPLQGLTISGGYTMTFAKIKEYKENIYAQNTQAGNYLNLVPRHMGYGWVFYDFHGAATGLKVGVGFNASSKCYVNTANTLEFPGWAVANAMVGYKFDNWRLQLNLNNIFDKTYYMTSVNTIGFIPEEKRNVMFTASFEI
ncbi:MAG: TonB-dependent receptor [Muribaculaceae bacterium]|nr:TonB-dependent receptor [Muribaculaceae bacterium]